MRLRIVRVAEVRQKQFRGTQRVDCVERLIPDFNVDIGRRRGGQNEFVAFDADSAGVADKSSSVLRVPKRQVMRSVARRVEHFKIAFADGDGFSAFEWAQIVFRNRKYGSIEAI